MKKRAILSSLAGVVALVLTVGVAWAATVQCQAGATECLGTTGADTVTGTNQGDFIRSLSGSDTVKASGGADVAQGGKGEDTVRGAEGNDVAVWGGEGGPGEPNGPFTDESDDEARGGAGADTLLGGYGQGGEDEIFGEEGNDTIQTHQRGMANELGVKVTKEIVDCGPGQDTVVFDRGLDEVANDCEDRTPVDPGDPAPVREGSPRLPEFPFE